jgi:hypothetical protein
MAKPTLDWGMSLRAHRTAKGENVMAREARFHLRGTPRSQEHAAVRGWTWWGRLLGLFSIMGLLVVIVPATTGGAIPSGGFESSDGDLDHDSSTDWNDFDNAGTPAIPSGFAALTTVPDRRGNPDDIFNGGVKQDKACPAVKTGSLGGGDSKFDVSRLYLTQTEVGGDEYLYLAWVRVPQNSTTASSHIAFEFNQGETTCTSNGTALNPDLIVRTEGDKLLVYDFEGGSSAPTLKLATWITDAADGPCEVTSNSVPCWALDTGFDASDWDARVNIASVGSVLDENPTPDQNLGIVEFGEAGINLTEAVDDVCAFSGHVTGVARSSGSSGTAQMKDKVGPAVFELPGCVAETNITTVQTLHDKATINGLNSQGAATDGTEDTSTLTFSLYGPADPDCDGTPVYTRTFTGIDTATYSTSETGTGSAGYEAVTAGTYNWIVDYSGDTTNTPFTTLCGDEQAIVSYGA